MIISKTELEQMARDGRGRASVIKHLAEKELKQTDSDTSIYQLVDIVANRLKSSQYEAKWLEDHIYLMLTDFCDPLILAAQAKIVAQKMIRVWTKS